MSSAGQFEIARQKQLLVDALLRAEGEVVYPASLAQRRLWFLHQLQDSTAAYNVHVGLWLVGTLDVNALRASLQAVVDRHETLRTSFRLREGELEQMVSPSHLVHLPVSDFTHVPDPWPGIYQCAKQELETPFELNSSPLFRARVFRANKDEHIFLCVMHHIITDAWSMQIFTKELAHFYAGFSKSENAAALPELPIQYGDFSDWQRQSLETDALQKQLSYWKQTLQNAPPVLELPQDRPRPAEQTFRGATHNSELPADLVERIHLLAKQQQVTPFMLLLAAFKVLLYRYSGQPDVLVGVPVAGRNRVETEGLIGFFVNTLAFRDDLRGNPKFVDLLARVRETTLAGFAHADVPFETVVQALQPERNLSYNPIFQIMFSAVKSPIASQAFGDLKLYPYIIDANTSIFDVNMSLVEWGDGRFWIQIDYNTELFDAGTIERIEQHFCNLLTGIVAHPERRIADLQLLSAAEEHELIVEFNQTKADFRGDVCLHEFFEEQVARTPKAVAAISGRERISYEQLNKRAGRLASYLLSRGVGPETLVGLCADRSIRLLVGILGILKAGAAYVPLDPTYPSERLNCILADAKAKVLVTEKKFRHIFEANDVDCIDLDRDFPNIDQTKLAPVKAAPDNLAYVLFTSGSTGRPKGVALEHRNASNFVQWAQTVFKREELAGTLFATSVCFDLSVFEIFVPWSLGGTVIVAPNAVMLAELPAADKVTLINTVPSAMTELLRAGAVPKSVMTVNLAGEPLPEKLVRAIYDQTSVQNVYNLYGPTEATTYATYTRVPRTGDVSIGTPVANTQAYILDLDGNLVPKGGRGELYLAGDGLARGYFGRPDLTAERFVAHSIGEATRARLYRTGDLCRYRSDGSIEYLGRLDHQVKLRGFRIELGEIESLLEKHATVRQAIAAIRDAGNQKRLVAYVTTRANHEISTSALRQYLEQALPSYMIPDAFVVMDEFPRMLNGKVDRKSLPSPEAPAASVVQPRNELETTLVEIWQRVLSAPSIGVTDNFFDLGGHSLLAARLITEMKDVTGRKISLSAIFRAPTIESLAKLIASEAVSRPDPLLMHLHHAGDGVPFFAIAAPGVDSFGLALLARNMGNEHPVYKLQAPGRLIWERPFEKEELRALSRQYIQAMRSVQANGPYCVGGMCEGVLIAQQMILDLEAEGEEVGLFAIFDTWVLENSQIRPLWALEYYRQRIRTIPDLSLNEQLAILRRTFKRWTGNEDGHRTSGNGWPRAYWPGASFQEPRFRAPVLLFKRPRQPYFYVRDPNMGWSARSSGGVEICEVNCGHFEILREPHVRVLAEKLTARLRALSEPDSGSSLHLQTIPTGTGLESELTQPAQ